MEKFEFLNLFLFESRPGERLLLLGRRIVDILVRIDVLVLRDEGDLCARFKCIFHVATLVCPSLAA